MFPPSKIEARGAKKKAPFGGDEIDLHSVSSPYCIRSAGFYAPVPLVTTSAAMSPPIPAALPRRAKTALLIEGLTSLGASQLMLGVFFFTSTTLGWQPRHNLLMAAGQGFVYIVAALSADWMARRLNRRGALVLASSCCAIISLAGLAGRHSSPLVAATLLLYTIASTLVWPVLEGIVASGCDAREMSRRVGIYNLVWSGVNIIGVALIGTLLMYWPAGVFIVPAVAHAGAVVLTLTGGRLDLPVRDTPGSLATVSSHDCVDPASIMPEPELIHVRRLALALSRIALPATYMVAYAMMALMPALPAIEALPTSLQTLVSSVWLAVRWLAFLWLGAAVWWHTRPMWLLWATLLMLGAFLAITIRPTDLLHWLGAPGAPDAGPVLDLTSMIMGQVALGLAVALIYAGSLYFGMVLSDGSTEHGGYHEALIGVGSVLGPGAGALAQWLYPGQISVSIAAVGSVIALAGVAGAIAALRARRD